MRSLASAFMVMLLLAGTLLVAFDVRPVEASEIALELGEAGVNAYWDLRLRLIPGEKSSTVSSLILEATSHQQVLEARLALNLDSRINLIEGETVWVGPFSAYETKTLMILVDLRVQGSYEVKGYAVSTNPECSDGSMVTMTINVDAEGGISTRIYDGVSAPSGTQSTQVTIFPGEGNSINVKGYFYYLQSADPWVQLPIRGAEVGVYDDDGLLGWQKMGSGYTNDDGYFEITGMHNPSDLLEWSNPDVFVEVDARNWVTEILNNPWWWLLGNVYRFKTNIVQDVGDNDVVDVGGWICPAEQNVVWDIFDTMQAGYWFMVDETSNSPPRVRSFYNDVFQGDTAFYFAKSLQDNHGLVNLIPDWLLEIYDVATLFEGSTGIHFPAVSGLTADSTILHEYGHFIMDVYADLAPPTPVAPHYYDESYNPEHAFVEGWAHFFSAAVRQWWGASVDEFARNPDVESPPGVGDSCEASVAGILWDVFDGPAIMGGFDDDDLSLGFDPIWKVLTIYDPNEGFTGDWPLGADHPWTIYDFWDGFPYAAAGSIASGELLEILHDHGIDLPDSVPPVNPTEFTSSPPVNTTSLQGTVTVTWSGAYDVLDGHNINVREYIYWFDGEWLPWNPPLVIPPFPYRKWYYNVVPDVNGTGTFRSPALLTSAYYLNVRAVDIAGNLAPDMFQMGPFYVSDIKLATSVQAAASNPFDSILLVNSDTSVTMEVTAADPTPTTHYEITNSEGYSSGVQSYFDSFRFADFGLMDGRYTLHYYSEDSSGNVESENTRTIVVDSTPPSTGISFSDPNVVVGIGKLRITHVKSSTTITLNPSDGDGAGIKETKYRINNAVYDLGWQTYEGPVQLADMSDGAYWLEYYSIDNVGNVESSKKEVIVLDDVGPSMRIQLEEDTVLQDLVTLTTSAFDLGTGMGTVNYTLSRVSRTAITPVAGFIDLPSTSLPNNVFSLQLDLSSLPNGLYLFTAKGEDRLGNVAEASYLYPLYNIDATTLIPLSRTSKAGRTVPIKFTLRTNSLTDPDQPFVYNEGLTIDIRVNGASAPLQVSVFGADSTSYRIDAVAEMYIVNFKTASTVANYLVTIYRGTRIIGSFIFSTIK